MLKTLATSLLAVALLSGCIKGNENNRTCNYNECALKATAAEEQQVLAYLSANNVTNAVRHCSGVYYEIISQGTGAQPNACSAVRAQYVGRRSDNTIFDQGEFPQPYSLQDLVRGWTNTIPLLKVGGEINLYIPPSLGYGSEPVRNGSTVILPANSMLIFNVKLTSVN